MRRSGSIVRIALVAVVGVVWTPPPVHAQTASPPSTGAPVRLPELDVGLAHLDLGRYAEAAAAFELALLLKGEDANLYAVLGVARMLEGNLPAATAALERAVAMQPGDAWHHLRLGHAHRMRGDVTAAREVYENALRLDPENAAARAALKSVSRAPAVVEPSAGGARGARASRDAETPPVEAGEVYSGTRSYRGLLAAAYVAAPFLAAGGAAATESAVGVIPGVLLPTVVHVAYGNYVPGIVAPIGAFFSMLLGGAVGAALDPDCTGEFFCVPEGVVAGVLVGYIAWAVLDVAVFGEVEIERDADARVSPSIQLGAGPTRDGAGVFVVGRL